MFAQGRRPCADGPIRRSRSSWPASDQDVGNDPCCQPMEVLDTVPGSGVGSMGWAAQDPPPVSAPYQAPLWGDRQANQHVPLVARAASVTLPEPSEVEATLTLCGPVDGPSTKVTDGSSAWSAAASRPT